MNTARKRQQVSPLTIEIASLIDGAMASRRPKLSQLELARETGIGQSQLSRMLAPTKPMFIEEFIAVCQALALDPTAVIREAERRAALRAAVPAGDEGAALPSAEDPPAAHYSPVTEQDVREAGLPRQGGRPRRQRAPRQAHAAHQHGDDRPQE